MRSEIALRMDQSDRTISTDVSQTEPNIQKSTTISCQVTADQSHIPDMERFGISQSSSSSHEARRAECHTEETILTVPDSQPFSEESVLSFPEDPQEILHQTTPIRTTEISAPDTSTDSEKLLFSSSADTLGHEHARSVESPQDLNTVSYDRFLMEPDQSYLDTPGEIYIKRRGKSHLYCKL